MAFHSHGLRAHSWSAPGLAIAHTTAGTDPWERYQSTRSSDTCSSLTHHACALWRAARQRLPRLQDRALFVLRGSNQPMVNLTSSNAPGWARVAADEGAATPPAGLVCASGWRRACRRRRLVRPCCCAEASSDDACTASQADRAAGQQDGVRLPLFRSELCAATDSSSGGQVHSAEAERQTSRPPGSRSNAPAVSSQVCELPRLRCVGKAHSVCRRETSARRAASCCGHMASTTSRSRRHTPGGSDIGRRPAGAGTQSVARNFMRGELPPH